MIGRTAVGKAFIRRETAYVVLYRNFMNHDVLLPLVLAFSELYLGGLDCIEGLIGHSDNRGETQSPRHSGAAWTLEGTFGDCMRSCAGRDDTEKPSAA
jgi:hypothetical protein